MFYVDGHGKLCCIANVVTRLRTWHDDSTSRSTLVDERLDRGSNAVSALIDACAFSEVLCRLLRIPIDPLRMNSSAAAGKHSTAVRSLAEKDTKLVDAVSLTLPARTFHRCEGYRFHRVAS